MLTSSNSDRVPPVVTAPPIVTEYLSLDWL